MLSIFTISFYFAYIFLAGSSFLTGFEIFSYYPTKYQVLKYILAIETTVNIIASVAYNSLLTYINPINYNNLTHFRYLDWFATTPLLLISFTLYLQYLKTKNTNSQNTIQIEYDKLGIIIFLNLLMLLFGFLGETGKINHILGCILGFIPFVIQFLLIWKWYGDNLYNKNIFIIFILVWSFYGIVYLLPNQPKNISYNILDIISKVGFGLLIWFEVVRLRLNGTLPSHPIKSAFMNIIS